MHEGSCECNLRVIFVWGGGGACALLLTLFISEARRMQLQKHVFTADFYALMLLVTQGPPGGGGPPGGTQSLALKVHMAANSTVAKDKAMSDATVGHDKIKVPLFNYRTL